MTMAIARAAAVACVASFGKSLIGPAFGPNPCTNRLRVFFPGGDTPATTRHIKEAQGLGHASWYWVHRATNPTTTNVRRWYRGQPECEGKPFDQMSCDEFPFYRTLEGGPAGPGHPRASLKLTPGAEDGLQGNNISRFYGNEPLGCNVELGAPGDFLQGGYLVAPVSDGPFTFWVCGEPDPTGP